MQKQLKPKKKENKTFRKFLRFSGIGVQLGVMMYIASLGGSYFDTKFSFEKPWFTLLFIVVALVVFVLMLMKQLNKLNNE